MLTLNPWCILGIHARELKPQSSISCSFQLWSLVSLKALIENSQASSSSSQTLIPDGIGKWSSDGQKKSWAHRFRIGEVVIVPQVRSDLSWSDIKIPGYLFLKASSHSFGPPFNAEPSPYGFTQKRKRALVGLWHSKKLMVASNKL